MRIANHGWRFLNNSSSDQPVQSLRLAMGRLWMFIRPLRRKLAVLFSLLLGNGLLKLPVPFLTIYLIDRVIPSKSPHKLFLFVFVIVLMSLLFIASEFIRSYYGCATSRKLAASIHMLLLEHLQKLPMSFFAGKDTGYLMSRFLDDAAQLNSLVTDNLLSTLQSIITFVIGICAVFYINWQLALASLVLLPPFVVSTLQHGKRLRGLNLKAQEAKAVVSRNLHETLSGISVIKAFSRERWGLLRSFQVLKAAVRAELLAFVASSKLSAAVSFWGSVGSLLVLCYGGYQIMAGRLTLGELLGFNSVLAYLYGPSQSLASGYLLMQRSFSALQRVSEVLDLEPEPGLATSTLESKALLTARSLSFENVSFSYKPGQPVLEDISFEITAPAVVAVAGESGAGKSTLLKLLLRFHDPQEGIISLDGTDLRKINLTKLRHHIGFVSQDTFLFNTSILDNIRLGKRDASEADVQRAAKIADAHEFILDFPDGYATQVGEGGKKLSGGQRQRIAMARAILVQPRILIFDEASSSVDSLSEEQIWSSLKQLTSTTMVFIVSHRFSSLLHADVTLFLQNGRLTALGTHSELLKVPEYYQMYEHQLQLQMTV